jgi:hypothetical protein
MIKNKKIIIFDLDETLGYFTQLHFIWNDLINKTNISSNQNNFFILCDIFNEYFRKNIFEVLKFIHKQKIKKNIDKCIIYTNNNGDPSWTYLLKDYMEYKINAKVFDLCICAYNENDINNMRTTHSKCISDLEKILNIDIKKTNLCFIDDREHPDMKHSNTFYIQINPYFNEFNFSEISKRFKNSLFGDNFKDSEELNKFFKILKNTINNNKLIFRYNNNSSPKKVKETALLFSKINIFLLN